MGPRSYPKSRNIWHLSNSRLLRMSTWTAFLEINILKTFARCHGSINITVKSWHIGNQCTCHRGGGFPAQWSILAPIYCTAKDAWGYRSHAAVNMAWYWSESWTWVIGDLTDIVWLMCASIRCLYCIRLDFTLQCGLVANWGAP